MFLSYFELLSTVCGLCVLFDCWCLDVSCTTATRPGITTKYLVLRNSTLCIYVRLSVCDDFIASENMHPVEKTHG